MAGTTNGDPGNPGQPDPTNNGQPEPGAGNDSNGQPAPKADNGPKGGKDQLLAELAAERDRRQAAENKIREAELAKLPELERAQAKLQEAEARAAAAERKLMQRAVADRMKLPAELAETLVGESEKDMEAHAAKLAPYFRQPGSDQEPNNDPKPPNDAKRKGSAGKPTMSELIRAAAGY